MSKLRAISLFTGAGGLDLGMEAAGFQTRVAVEMDVDSVTTIRRNRPQWATIQADIRHPDASSARILASARLGCGDADILIGGPPCQPFSKSGYWAGGDSKRLRDPRATTLTEYLRVLADTQPRAFLLENVPGLSFSDKDEGLTFLRRRIDAINKKYRTTYSFSVSVLDAAAYGVPQHRSRLFVIGSRDGEQFEFPPGTFGDTVRSSGQLESNGGARTTALPYLTSWDAIGDLADDPDPELVIRGKWAGLVPTIPEGENYLFHTARGGGLPLFGWRTRYWSFLLKLAKALPSWTIAAEPGPAIGPFHWKNRRLSRIELMRLQTFPPDYVISGSLRSAQRQLGNAVPSLLAEFLGREIRAQFFGDKNARRDLSLLPERRGTPPRPEQTARVPRSYLRFKGDHPEHPGPGRGPGAITRLSGVIVR
jgi:DNA (cytosine-5)-methyltransferase 1